MLFIMDDDTLPILPVLRSRALRLMNLPREVACSRQPQATAGERLRALVPSLATDPPRRSLSAKPGGHPTYPMRRIFELPVLASPRIRRTHQSLLDDTPCLRTTPLARYPLQVKPTTAHRPIHPQRPSPLAAPAQLPWVLPDPSHDLVRSQ